LSRQRDPYARTSPAQREAQEAVGVQIAAASVREYLKLGVVQNAVTCPP